MRFFDGAAVDAALAYPALVDILEAAFRQGAIAPLRHHHAIALEGRPDTPFPEGLHDIVREQAEAHNAHLVEVGPQFEGKSREYIAIDLIHPNDTGYRVMADAVLAEMRRSGLIN